MDAFNSKRCDYPEITSLFDIMDEQEQHIQEANTLKYLAAVGLEEIYRNQDLAISLYGYLQPIIATGMSIYLGMDKISWQKILAAALVFTGVILVNKSRAAAQKEVKT